MYFIGGVAILSVVLIGVLLAFMWRRVVPTNMVHIVQSAKKTTSYGSSKPAGNVYYKIPAWIPKFGVEVSVFPLSIFDIGLKNYEAYDKGRLPFVVDVAAFFRIHDSDNAAVRVNNFQELQEQLVNVLQGAVRRILGTNELEYIMQDRAKLGQEFTSEVDEQLAEWGVSTAKTIEFMNLLDSNGSSVIANIMAKEQSRIEKESRETVAENQRIAQNAEISANRDVQNNRLEAEKLIGQKAAEKDQAVGISNEQARQKIQEEAAVTMQKNMLVKQVEEVRSAEIAKEVAEVAAKQDQQVRLVQADTDKETTIRIAEGNLQETLKNAEGIQAEGAAKADAEKQMLLAPVNAQLTLAKEIGENQGYQSYLINIRQVEAGEAVGKEMAGALKTADLKVIANGGSIQEGTSSLMEMFGPKGGTSLAGFVEAFSQTEQGQKIIDKVTSKK